MVLSYPNDFNQPSYNSYLSNYSNSYQVERFKCRKSFQTKAQDPKAYKLQPFAQGNDRPPSPDLPPPPPVPPDEVPPDFPYVGWPDNSADCTERTFRNDIFDMERVGCFKRQRKVTKTLTVPVCVPKEPPRLPFLGPPELDVSPPVYGGWIPDDDQPQCKKDKDDGDCDPRGKMASQLQNDLAGGGKRPNCVPSVTVFKFYGAGIYYVAPTLVFINKNATSGCPFMVYPKTGVNDVLMILEVEARTRIPLYKEAMKRLCNSGCRTKENSCPPYIAPTGRTFLNDTGITRIEYVTSYEPELTPYGMLEREWHLESIRHYGEMSDDEFASLFPPEHRWYAINLMFYASVRGLDKNTIVKRWLYRHFEYLGTYLVFEAVFAKVTSETFGPFTGKNARDAIGEIARTPRNITEEAGGYSTTHKLCSVGYLIEWICPDGSTDIRGPGEPVEPPTYLPGDDKKKDDKDKCMEACSCEQVKKLLGENNKTLVELIGLEDKKDRNKELWKRLEKIATDYHNKGSDNFFATIEECCTKLQKSAEDLLDEILDTRIKIREDINNIPGQVAERLSSEFAVIINKLNQILEKLKGSTEEKIIEILTLIASLIGLINDLKSLFGSTPDYSATLQQIISLLNTIKDATVVTVAGSVDSVQCDGTRSPNSWEGQGIAGIAQGIQALAVNLTLLHADLCGMSSRISPNIEYPMVRGRIDAITCDGQIIPSSWEGRGFDGINQAIHAIGNNLAILHADLCQILERSNDWDFEWPRVEGETVIESCKNTRITRRWNDTGFKGLNSAMLVVAEHLRHLHQDLCDLSKKIKKPEKVSIKERFECDDQTITVEFENEESIIKDEVEFLSTRITDLQKLICDLPVQSDGVPVFPGDTLEEREIPAQAVITFVESRYYPKIKGNLWHINIPYPKPDLITGKDCWQKFQGLELNKGKVHGRVFWLSPTGAHNRFNTGIYGRDENSLKAFLTQIASFSTLRVGTIRISTGGSPRLRPKDVHIRAVKVVILERDNNGTLQITKCCRAPKR